MSQKNTNRFWTFHLHRFCRNPACIMALSTISPTWIKLRAMNWMRCAFERFGVVRWCWPYNISIVLYRAVMWVFLTFVSKLLVLNHMRNNTEQLIHTFVVKRLINVIPYAMQTTEKLRCYWLQIICYIKQSCGSYPEFYQNSMIMKNQCISDMLQTFSRVWKMWKLWEKYEGIIEK